MFNLFNKTYTTQIPLDKLEYAHYLDRYSEIQSQFHDIDFITNSYVKNNSIIELSIPILDLEFRKKFKVSVFFESIKDLSSFNDYITEITQITIEGDRDELMMFKLSLI